MEQLSLTSIRLDGGTQPRTAINDEVVQDYAFSMMEGQSLPAVTVFYDSTDYWLADGFHRYYAARQICRDTIDADIKQGTRRDAVLYSVGTNAQHGLRRTNADKRKAVETLLSDEEWAKWSDREIARKTNTSTPFVSQIRITVNIYSDERTYITKYGTEATMNTANIGHSQPQEETQYTTLKDIFQPLAPTMPFPEVYVPTQTFEDVQDVQREAKRKLQQEHIAQLKEKGVELPTGKYSCLVVDPPWPMQKIEREERPNQFDFDYPTMDEEELKVFPLPDFAADNCHLYLWATQKHLPLALRLAEHWGFKYQCLMTWIKNVGFTPFSWMYSTEHVLFCRKGSLPLLEIGKRLDFEGEAFKAKVREHSRKPDVFYDLVKKVSPGPRLDVFSREKRDGFDQYGNEVEKYVPTR